MTGHRPVQTTLQDPAQAEVRKGLGASWFSMHSIQQDNFVLSESHPVKLPEPIPSDAEGTQRKCAPWTL